MNILAATSIPFSVHNRVIRFSFISTRLKKLVV